MNCYRLVNMFTIAVHPLAFCPKCSRLLVKNWIVNPPVAAFHFNHFVFVPFHSFFPKWPLIKLIPLNCAQVSEFMATHNRIALLWWVPNFCCFWPLMSWIRSFIWVARRLICLPCGPMHETFDWLVTPNLRHQDPSPAINLFFRSFASKALRFLLFRRKICKLEADEMWTSCVFGFVSNEFS